MKINTKKDSKGPVQHNFSKKSGAGFTLIEILVVIGIIAILAAVVLIAINPARQFAQANNSQRTSNTNAILNAIGQYMADHQGALPAGITNAVTEIGGTLCTDLVSDYLPALPTDPASDSEGAGISEPDCTTLGADDVSYTVVQDSTTQRITVAAPDTELCSIPVCPPNEQITVTR